MPLPLHSTLTSPLTQGVEIDEAGGGGAIQHIQVAFNPLRTLAIVPKQRF